jgi:hypothetical protein
MGLKMVADLFTVAVIPPQELQAVHAESSRGAARIPPADKQQGPITRAEGAQNIQ